MDHIYGAVVFPNGCGIRQAMGTATVRAAAAVSSQAEAPEENLPEPPSVRLASLLGSTALNGFVDLYYGLNFHHPANLQNSLDLFSLSTNQFGLNMVELNAGNAPNPTAGKPGRAGYSISVDYGQGSRDLTVSNAIPYSHVGVRATYRFNDRVPAQGSLDNGGDV